MNHPPGNLAYRLYQLIWQALDWLYPPNCGGCGQAGERWCPGYAHKTLEPQTPICPICGNQITSDQPCRRCRESPPFYTSLRACTVFTGSIREAIHKLKYGIDIGLGEALSRQMIESLGKLNWPLDMITSIPLGLARLDERGYNQATLLARPIALYYRIPFSTKALTRIRKTRSQVGLSVAEREVNMEAAFQADRELVEDKKILLVDEVATSSATLNPCARVLLDEGATEVYGLSLARAVFDPDDQGDSAWKTKRT
jgi:ComF family protein